MHILTKKQKEFREVYKSMDMLTSYLMEIR